MESNNLFYIINVYKPLLVRSIKLIYVPIIAATLLGLYSYSKEKKVDVIFDATIIYMLEEELNGGGKSETTNPMLLAIMGGGGSSNKDLMVDLAQSNKLLETTLLKTVVIDSELVVLANYYIDNCGMRANWIANGNEKMMAFKFPENYQTGLNKNTDYLIRSISRSIKESFVSNTLESGLIYMEYFGNHEVFTKTLLDNHFLTISEFYARRKSKRSSDLIATARKKKDSLLLAVRARESGLASGIDRGFGAVMSRSKLGEVGQQRELEIAQAQYVESVMAYNSALLDLERNKPLISVVDDPRYPLKSVYPEPLIAGLKTFAVILIFGIVILIGLLFGLDFLKNQKEEYTHISS